MSFDPKKSCKFLFIFFHGVENIAAKGTMVDIDDQFKNEWQIHNYKNYWLFNPKTVKEVPER